MFCKAALERGRDLAEVSGEWIQVEKRYVPDPEHSEPYGRLAALYETCIERADSLCRGLSEPSDRALPRDEAKQGASANDP